MSAWGQGGIALTSSAMTANGMDRRFPISLVERINRQELIPCRRTQSQPNAIPR
jgi:hypothetical protein